MKKTFLQILVWLIYFVVSVIFFISMICCYGLIAHILLKGELGNSIAAYLLGALFIFWLPAVTTGYVLGKVKKCPQVPTFVIILAIGIISLKLTFQNMDHPDFSNNTVNYLCWGFLSMAFGYLGKHLSKRKKQEVQ